MKDEHKHTNLPWRNRVMGSEGCRIFPDCEDKREAGKFIAMVNGRDFWTDQANAEFIVRACNSHYKLLEALEAMTLAADMAIDEHNLAINQYTHATSLKQNAVAVATKLP